MRSNSPVGPPQLRFAALLLLSLIGVSSAVGQAPAPLPASLYESPGRLVTLPDRRRLNIRCFGQGSPTVLLESGFGAGSFAWGRVQPIVARATRVCAYDRAGYGFSDPGPMPRDAAAIARDLDAALRVAGVTGPYIVVGHSAGGLYASVFAARRARDVVGMVLVDSSAPYQEKRFEALFGPGAGSLDGLRAKVAECLSMTLEPSAYAAGPARERCAPAALKGHDLALALRPETWRTQASELDELAAGASEQVEEAAPALRGIPVTVLTASTRPDGVPAPMEDVGAGAWQAMHRQMAAAHRRNEVRLVRSSHLMMNDRPEVVAAAILQFMPPARR